DSWNVFLVHQQIRSTGRPNRRVVQPCADDEQAPEIAPVLVEHDVVRVITAACVQLKRPEIGRLGPWRRINGHGAVTSRYGTGHAAEKDLEIGAGEVTPVTGTRHDLRFLANRQRGGVEAHEVALGNEVASGVRESRGHYLTAGRHLRVIG